MAINLSDDRVRQLRQRAQRLDPASTTGGIRVDRLLREIVALQAQDLPAATFGLRPRSAGLEAADVDRARNVERSVVRMWCMRGTLHLVAAEDVGWLLALFGPVFIRSNQRRRAQLGLDDDTCRQGVSALRALLSRTGPLTRAEIVTQLAGQGFNLEGQRAPHLLAYAALAGVVCQGPDRGRDAAYVLLDDWIAREPAPSRGAALAELARRYLAAFGPAGLEDLATWSGLPMADVRAAWARVAPEHVEVTYGNRSGLMHQSQVAWLDDPRLEAPLIRLLPAFDTYLLGHRDRSLIVAPAYARRVNAGGGILHPVLLVDGQARGTWRARPLRNALEVVVAPFEPLPDEVGPGLEQEVSDLGRFLGLTASLKVARPP